MRKFRNVAVAVMAALMVVGMNSTAFAASASTYAVTSSTVDGDGVTKSVTYIHLEDGEEVEVGTTSVTLAAEEWSNTASATETVTLYMSDDSGSVIRTFDLSSGQAIPGNAIKWGISGYEAWLGWPGYEVDYTQDSLRVVVLTNEENIEYIKSLIAAQASAAEEEVYDPNTYIDDVITKIETAAVDGTGVAKTEGLTGLSIDMMRALEENNVALEMSFDYDGVEYNITIPAGGAIVDEDIPWYGPLYLLAHYGQGTAATTSAASGSTYTVVSSDTLSLIAAEHDMGLAELAAKNPQITNMNIIFPGQVINL